MDNKESLEIINPPVFGTDTSKPAFSYPAPQFSLNSVAKPHKVIFWKVASVSVGAAIVAGSTMSYIGLSDYLLPMAIPLSLMSLLGGSIAVGNFFHLKRKKAHPMAPIILAKAEQPAEPARPATNSPIITVVYDNSDEHPSSDTYERDKVIASAKQALLSLDHTKTTSH